MKNLKDKYAVDADGNTGYTIKKGDTLSGIAAANGTTVKDLVEANKIKDPNSIYAGDTLVIPGYSNLSGGTPTETKKAGFEYDDFTYDDFTYDDYMESDIVTEAKNALDAQLANKPGAYQSQWQGQLNEVIGKILNREKFSYDLNGDALYQQYKDKYTQQAKMAMADTMGQAAAMTGGYGNSYAQSVGQQMYAKEMQNLNDVVPELYAMAYDKYNQEGQDLYNQYSMLGAQEEQEYGRYRDSVSDWLSERDYLQNRYDSERDFDYSKYNNERNFAYGQYADDRNFSYGQYSDDKNLAYTDYRNAIADEQWQKEFDEAQRQHNASLAAQYASLAEQQRQFDESMKYQKEQDALKAKESTPDPVTPVKPKDPEPADLGFTGKTYQSAVEFMKSKGVPNGNASGVMTSSEWSTRKASYQRTGQGNEAVKNYNSYQEYLADFVEYAVETYGK